MRPGSHSGKQEGGRRPGESDLSSTRPVKEWPGEGRVKGEGKEQQSIR